MIQTSTSNCNKHIPKQKVIYEAMEFSDDLDISNAFDEFFTNIEKNLCINLKNNNINSMDFVT